MPEKPFPSDPIPLFSFWSGFAGSLPPFAAYAIERANAFFTQHSTGLLSLSSSQRQQTTSHLQFALCAEES